jgi:peptidoglycan hydrolase-like protein with peptidoglycan-binding domain
LHNKVKVARAIDAVTSVGNEVITGQAVDLAGYKSAEFAISYGNKTDGAVAVELQECDTVGGAYTAVADADLLGTEAAVSVADGVAGANTVKKLGYRGSKLFLKLVATITSNAGSCPLSAVAVLGHPNHAPVA